jgi:sulfoquinovosidase
VRTVLRLLGLLAAITLVVTAIDRLLPAPPLAGRLTAVAPGVTATAEVGDFVVALVGERPRDVALEVRPLADPDRLAFASLPGEAFVAAAGTTTTWHVDRGHVTFDEDVVRRLPDQTVDEVDARPGRFAVSGRVTGSGDDAAAYVLAIEAAGDGRLRLTVDLTDTGPDVADTGPTTGPSTGRPPLDRTVLSLAADPDEAVLGLGEQFTHLDLKGRVVPILTREQGVGRGAQPLTLAADLTAGAGGDWTWTYSAVPLAISTRGTAVLVEDTHVARFDLSVGRRTTIDVWRGDGATVQLVDGPDPRTLLARTTAVTGRMRPLPTWLDDGLVIGLQGGTEVVRDRVARVQAAGVPLAAVWLQDWVGQRTTSFGDRLWWSWTLDRERYPGWEQLVDDLAADGIRVLTYANPFLAVDPPPGTGRRPLYEEARDAGHLVTRPDGSPYAQDQGEFDAVLVDLTDPAAWAWYRDVLVEEVAGVGASGWMADFGESLPFDAVLHAGDPVELHNAWPVLWAELTREVLEASGLADDGVAFLRAGGLRSPEHATLFWLGDQLVDFSDEDGLGSAVTGLLSGGLSGWTLNHSDTGGYTAIRTPVASWVRDRELLQRWFELNAFGVVLRTHEGNRPRDNHQVDDDAATLTHAAAMTRIFVALAPERRRLVEEAAVTGTPVVRHGWLVAPDDPRAAGWDRQLFLGDDLLLAPVTRAGATEVRIDVPAGRWVDPWTGAVLVGGPEVRISHPAPIGRPAVLVREGRPVADLLGPELLAPAARPGPGQP